MYVQSVIDFIAVYRKNTATIHLNEGGLKLINIISIFLAVWQLINSLETNVHYIKDLLNKLLSKILHTEHQVTHAVDYVEF